MKRLLAGLLIAASLLTPFGALGADDILQVPPDGSGKKLDASSKTVGSNTVYDERYNIADPTSNNVAAVKAASTAVGSTDPALAVGLSPNSPLPAGTATLGSVKITDGTNTAAVKAASTAPVATDPAAVVSFSPNSPLPAGTATIGAVKITDGTNVGAVKAASTAATATDPAIVVSLSPNSPETPPTLTKGTQGANGFSVQDLKDAGRTQFRYYATAVASGTTGTETIFTLTQSSGTSATTTATTFTPTSGKNFRITGITFASRGNATATAQVTKFSLRLNTAGACVVTSTPILYQANTATAAVASAYDRFSPPLYDGDEIVGNGTLQWCLTANSVFVTNAPTWDVLITGYTY